MAVTTGYTESFDLLTLFWQIAHRTLECVHCSIAAFQNPVENADVFAEAGPQEFAVFVHAEPVHVEDLGHLADEAKRNFLNYNLVWD